MSLAHEHELSRQQALWLGELVSTFMQSFLKCKQYHLLLCSDGLIDGNYVDKCVIWGQWWMTACVHCDIKIFVIGWLPIESVIQHRFLVAMYKQYSSDHCLLLDPPIEFGRQSLYQNSS